MTSDNTPGKCLLIGMGSRTSAYETARIFRMPSLLPRAEDLGFNFVLDHTPTTSRVMLQRWNVDPSTRSRRPWAITAIDDVSLNVLLERHINDYGHANVTGGL